MDLPDLQDFCQRWLDAWSGNRPEALVDFFCPDGLYRDPARPGGLRGRDEILEYFLRLLARNPDWRFSLVELWPVPPESLVVKWRLRIPVGERVVEEVGVHLLELRAGRVWRCEVYFDRTGWREAQASSREG